MNLMAFSIICSRFSLTGPKRRFVLTSQAKSMSKPSPKPQGA